MASSTVNFTLPNLKTLSNSPYSCVHCVKKCAKVLHLLPDHLSDIKISVTKLLRAQVTAYDPRLKGIILGHHNIQIINNIQLTDNGNFELEYISDVYLFKPEVGNLLSGAVNKKSNDHIGVLVHSFINATIPRPRNKSECPKPWAGFDTSIGQSVNFEVLKINLCGRLPFIKGKLIDTEENDFDDKDSGIGGHESIDENISVKEGLETNSSSDNEIKNKKIKKSSIKRAQDNLNLNSDDSSLLYKELANCSLENERDAEQSSSEKKSKKKKKSLANEVSPVNNLHESLVKTPKLKKKKSALQINKDLNSEDLVNCSIEDTSFSIKCMHTEKRKKKKKSLSADCLEETLPNSLMNNEQISPDQLKSSPEDFVNTLSQETTLVLEQTTPKKKKKRKSQKSSGICSVEKEEDPIERSKELNPEDILNKLLDETEHQLINCSPVKKKKKKSSCKIDCINAKFSPCNSKEDVEEKHEVNKETTTKLALTTPEKKKKRKSRKSSNIMDIENDSLKHSKELNHDDINSLLKETEMQLINCSPVKKKKKKKSSCKIDCIKAKFSPCNSIEDVEEKHEVNKETTMELALTTPEKKKKRKSRKSSGIDMVDIEKDSLKHSKELNHDDIINSLLKETEMQLFNCSPVKKKKKKKSLLEMDCVEEKSEVNISSKNKRKISELDSPGIVCGNAGEIINSIEPKQKKRKKH